MIIFGTIQKIGKGYKKKFLCTKMLFRHHISNKKKYFFPLFGGRGGPEPEWENSHFFLYFFFEPFPYAHLTLWVLSHFEFLHTFIEEVDELTFLNQELGNKFFIDKLKHIRKAWIHGWEWENLKSFGGWIPLFFWLLR